MTFEAEQSRVDALVRLMGVIVLVFGILLLYYTYANAGVAGQAAEIVTINYSLGLVLSAVGVIVAFAKFK
ncbi:MAG: hypothetical protein JRN59_06445 [Nitrososphaerota archaeon]|jgi:hypothetical protein|nr:hypothetical protein [Nitrososphaerota archaeon]MDG6921149.1 hypothetical protein [Nitrososphaerota archaeon]MDG6949540.1 hypothetical protein [Nitrososphaerota archaeon]